MSIDATVETAVQRARAKHEALHTDPLSILIGGAMAGAYVGVAIILILTLGAVAPVALRALVMGVSFGLALILVVIAGAELFTGYTMYAAMACMRGAMTLRGALKINIVVWSANLIGALILVAIYFAGQGVLTHGESAAFVQTVAGKKMHYAASVLVARGALCNWLVCLALWMAMRTSNDAAKCIVIGWCLFAFIAAGFEHSVANMTVHLLALAGPVNPEITLIGATHNLFWVTLGNTIGGAVFVGMGYVTQMKRQSGPADEK